MRGFLGPVPYPICGHSHEVTGMTLSFQWLTPCGSASLSISPSPTPLSPHLPTALGIFWLDWTEGDLGTYQLAMMSFLLFLFLFLTKQNKTKKCPEDCVSLIYSQLDTGMHHGWREGDRFWEVSIVWFLHLPVW